MTRQNKPAISNTQLPDSSSKLIFGDNVLSAQFFRDYADLEILRSIKPEDVEDVSGRYVPLYGSERESDTVKKVDISKYLSEYLVLKEDENQLDLPLYIVPLIEHKTKTEYNVVMQILRYMVFIWEDYEKEMNRQHEGISDREVEEILKDTPDHLLEIMSKVMRALLYSMELPEEETESMVSMIKERKMGRLFENVTMNIQEERRERARAEAERDAALEKLDAAGKFFEIYKHVSRMLRNACPEGEIKKALEEKFSLTEEEACEEYRKVLEEY